MVLNKETIESIFLDLTDSNRFRVTPVIGDDYVRIEIRQVITNDSDDYFKYDAISEPVAMFVDYVSEVFEVPVITDYEFEYVFYWNGERIEDGFDNKAPFSLFSKAYSFLYKATHFLHFKPFFGNSSISFFISQYLHFFIKYTWAKTEDEVYELNHYTNFQPLYWVDNYAKGNRWCG